jgi:amidase
MTDVLDLDACGQAERVRRGEISPIELVEAAIARAEAVNPTLNAIIHERYDRARVEAASPAVPDGPFRGVPIVLKDLDGTMAGEPYHAGTRFLQRHGYVATEDTELVRRFRAAGFVVLGRTNTPELGLQPTTEPAAYGATRNPWAPDRSTGGSSGGSAAAVAAGICAVGHAGDGGGSIRIPASMCGLVGLKPSRGRITLAPSGEAWAGAVARLVVTRTVRDTAAVLDAVAGPAPGDPYVAPPPARRYVDELAHDPARLRVGWSTAVPNGVCSTHPEVAAVVSDVAVLLAELGHDVVEAAPAWDDASVTDAFVPCYGVWTARELDELGRLVGEPVTAADVEPATWAIGEMGRTVTGIAYHESLDALHAFGRRLAAFWDGEGRGYDVLLCPTVPEPAPPLGSFDGGPDNPLHGLFRSTEIVPFTLPFNVTGQPALSLPLGTTPDGLPVGVQLVAAAGREDVLLGVAAQLERARPWTATAPPSS